MALTAAHDKCSSAHEQQRQSRRFRNRRSQKATEGFIVTVFVIVVIPDDIVARNTIGFGENCSRHTKGGVAAAVVQKAQPLLWIAGCRKVTPHDVVSVDAISLSAICARHAQRSVAVAIV